MLNFLKVWALYTAVLTGVSLFGLVLGYVIVELFKAFGLGVGTALFFAGIAALAAAIENPK